MNTHNGLLMICVSVSKERKKERDGRRERRIEREREMEGGQITKSGHATAPASVSPCANLMMRVTIDSLKNSSG